MSNIERRDFLKVLGATGVGAGVAGCGSGPTDTLLPYVIPHEEIVPGMATWYRTTCRECPAGCGMNIRTREGRAVKAEGNPLSPISHGALCARGQASLHGLYDPDRVPQALARNGEGWDKLLWDEAEERLSRVLEQRRGTGVILTHAVTGTMDQLLDEFAAAYQIERVRWETFAYEPLRAAAAAVYGVDGVPVHDFSRAEVVITFGADFMETWLSPVDYSHGFVQAHAYDRGRRGHYIAVGPHQSLTEMNADEWIPCRPGTEHLVAAALARLVAEAGGGAGAGGAALAGVDVNAAAQAADVSTERLRQVAARFANGGASLAAGPGVASQHGAATQLAMAVAMLNRVAGNVGTTIRTDAVERHAGTGGSYADMQALLERMRAQGVGFLLVHGPNPLYGLPDQEAVREALSAVPFIASFSPMLDETSETAHLLLPDHHFLESWGDLEPRSGVTALVQPVMVPVFDSKQTGDVLLSVARRGGVSLPTQGNTFYDYMRTRWRDTVYAAAGAGADFETWWREALQTGLVLTNAANNAGANVASNGAANTSLAALTAAQVGMEQLQPAPFAGDGDFHLIVYPSYKYYDGRLANRLWLQELPDPVSKWTWNSWVEMNPAAAEELGLDNGHIAEVETPQGTVELPVWRHPGVRPDTIAIQLGQGHEGLGQYARERGVNAARLLAPMVEAASGAFVWQQTRASVRSTGRWERPTQQGLESDQHNRGIAQAMRLEDARSADVGRGAVLAAGITAAPPEPVDHSDDPHFIPHPQDATVETLQGGGGWEPLVAPASPQAFPPPGTHYGEYSEEHPRWGMAIDLERCTGCSACITACYAENNVGVVGPEQVAKGRILHWIRIERYFESDPEHPEELQTRFLPMMCQQCSNAPCEPVCPVYAAYHTPDGLNAQVYNRCVGTRYCANNCPYKVRTYNWFTWEWPEPLNWQLNPDVTVREKGVMEKCTFCVQKIRDAENNARLEDRGVGDGEIVPACAATCPGEAIVFGNLKDPAARVTQLASSGRGYRVLDQLNTQSAITYLRSISEHADDAGAGH
ncbi:MAG: molybdopterin dinucleotide binding domain-containing protein [Gemmatimonadota bacterium]